MNFGDKYITIGINKNGKNIVIHGFGTSVEEFVKRNGIDEEKWTDLSSKSDPEGIELAKFINSTETNPITDKCIELKTDQIAVEPQPKKRRKKNASVK